MTLFRPTIEQIAALTRDDRPVCAFVYDLDALMDHARSLVSALPRGAEFFYAVKANNDPRVLRALAPHVAGFEVASAGEIRRVRAAVGLSARIIMGGPARTGSDIATLLAHGVERLHLESLQAMRIANAVAEAAGAILPVLLRVNLAGPVPGATLTMGGAATQFGIEEAAIPDAIAVLRDCPALRFEGFHFHTVSNNRDAAGHAALCAAELALARRWAEAYGLDLRLVNLGGGWGVDYADPDWRFDADAFARLLAPHLDARTRVQFECGRIVAAYHAAYVCEIVDLKRAHGRAFALLRGGTHHFRLPNSWAHDHPFAIQPREAWHNDWPRPEIAGEPLTLAGELCTPKDILARDIPVERARIGDRVVFLMAGAYGWDISHHDFLCHAHPERLFLADGAVVPEQSA
ncbi:type III PLP-dependent enzyme [Methylobacterium haplocladii]|uniref:Diaminopimelate decarboxylase n=1 Tax=Methylobacterium haplocladii TaxID=1176176 RepID=A0A512INM4_9HYPH|nr:type III PLP-dependent enzyme [Methylobacterium haplocladii]GEO99313.1 diaminopimelate decarboxylase [Methylobacterium haplocladii]GJD83486.1 2-[(L-alanin-3-ylcarbamoyl)methyl]-2-hydroxybutanedioate decarboxylase [Methylobacterium haplocladii]GLS61087.1 staphyloferrin B biosynthesis decarboxylase SbnH [Methylobacterium haplocladii]